MKVGRGIFAAALGVACLHGPAAAQGIGLGASVGANVPNGKFGDNTKTGLVADGFLELRFNKQIALRGEGLWSRSDLDNALIRKVGNVVLPTTNSGNVTGDVNMIGGIGNLVIGLGSSFVQPYLIGGYGIYHRRVAQDVSGTLTEFKHINDSESKFGYNGGVGIKLSLIGISAFAEARYHSVNTTGARTNFIPVTVGLMF